MLTIAIVEWTKFFDDYAFVTVRVVGPFSSQQDAEAYLSRKGFECHKMSSERNAGWRKDLNNMSYEMCYFRTIQPT